MGTFGDSTQPMGNLGSEPQGPEAEDKGGERRRDVTQTPLRPLCLQQGFSSSFGSDHKSQDRGTKNVEARAVLIHHPWVLKVILA